MAIKILIVDDEKVICDLFAAMLKQYGNYHIMTETDGRRVLSLLRQEQFDVVLLDLLMPAIHGLDLLKQIKQVFENLPVIIVTGHGSIETAVTSMQAGAVDFVTKPMTASVLDIRIKKAVENAHTRWLATTDGLTGLYNHRAFQDRLQQEVERGNRYCRPLSLIMIDIDYFKDYNDANGHLQGDAALLQVAQILKSTSRASDFVARYGGEEFVLILPETDRENAERLGTRLREAVEHHRFGGEEHLPGQLLTISVGVASHTPPDTKEALLEAADMALYQAKRQGRNCICIVP